MTRNIEETTAVNIRKIMMQMSFESAAATHLGGGLSLVEIFSCLYGNVMKFKAADPHWPERDRFILSKGHGVLAYFATLNYFGYISDSQLRTFMKNGSLLIAHPIMNVKMGIESSNGSLGQGLSFGAGLAKAAKLKNATHRIFVLMGDGECNEGSVWEAAETISELELDNIIAIVDANGYRSDGEVGNGGSALALQQKFQSFGWRSIIVDGHDIEEIYKSIISEQVSKEPLCIIAKTIKGKGISFMENNNAWHHARITKSNFDLAMSELKS